MRNQRIVWRADLDVPRNGDQILDDFRLQLAAKGLRGALEMGAKEITVIGHSGRPSKGYDEKLSLSPVAMRLERILGRPVNFPGHSMNTLENPINVLENLRFDPREKANDIEFAKELAKHGDIFVDDAFATSHRKHASNNAITNILPSFMGPEMLRNANLLTNLFSIPRINIIAIIGGSKIDGKVSIIKELLPRVHKMIIGSGIADAVLDQVGFDEKMVIPIDYVQDNGQKVDIGPVSLDFMRKDLLSSATILWVGPLGKFEQPPFDKGTRTVFNMLMEKRGSRICIGGGDLIHALPEAHKYMFVTTGGSAALNWICKDYRTNRHYVDTNTFPEYWPEQG